MALTEFERESFRKLLLRHSYLCAEYLATLLKEDGVRTMLDSVLPDEMRKELLVKYAQRIGVLVPAKPELVAPILAEADAIVLPVVVTVAKENV